MIFELVIDVIVIVADAVVAASDAVVAVNAVVVVVAASDAVVAVVVEPLFAFLGWIVISGDEKHHISTRSVSPK